ncbi:unnamed protein product [Ceutorhynchus assimilis]|uniref:Choline transporter-like protein n=1 Tax=Ceutorhynchus assimilis TaxID=467358 RepID=A0A9N9MWC3_9CUCU|nr:unnamed protein product [Ceutorhynchus assimilis]
MGKQLDLGKKFEYDPTFTGPVKRRSCTDIICLFIFLGFIVGWAVLGIWALKYGNLKNGLNNGRDSSGQRCGIDPTVENLPYLFYFDVTECQSSTVPYLGCSTKQVCVSQCPNTTFYDTNEIPKVIAIPYCTYEQRKKNTYDETNCPKWFVPSEEVHNRCLPSLSTLNNKTLTEIEKTIENFSSIHLGLWASINTGSTQISNSGNHSGFNTITAEFVDSWWRILIGVVVAFVSNMTYILMLRWFAGFMVWFSIDVGVAALAAVTIYFCILWQNSKGGMNDNEDSFLALFIISAIFLVLIILLLIALRSKIKLAIALMREGSKAIASATSVLFFPILPLVLQIAVTAYSILVWAYLYNTPKSKLANVPFVFYILNIFGFFWSTWFVSALSQMVLAQVFAEWYWTMRKRNLPFFALTAAFYRTIRYHLGTLSFGSVIIAIIGTLKFLLKNRLKKVWGLGIICRSGCECCFDLLPKYVTKNAYIMCAIHGQNFCRSAKDAFALLMRNIVRVFVLNKVTNFVFFISEVLITVGVGAAAYLFLMIENSHLKDDGIPVIILIMIITFLISCLFFNVYSVAIDTIFLCFLEDCERNDGKERPYYMSRNLWKILMKKSKTPKYE